MKQDVTLNTSVLSRKLCRFDDIETDKTGMVSVMNIVVSEVKIHVAYSVLAR